MYHLMDTEPHYDWLLFLDSDAVVYDYHLKVTEFLSLVETGPVGFCTALSFLNTISPCSALFSSDQPWQHDDPNSGMWLIKRNDVGQHLVSTWWHINNTDDNLRFPLFEQATLQQEMFHPHQGIRGSHHTRMEIAGHGLHEVVGVIDEPTMVIGSRMQFVVHKYNGRANERLPFFEGMIHHIQHDPHFDHLPTNFTTVLSSIIRHHTSVLDTEVDHIPTPNRLYHSLVNHTG